MSTAQLALVFDAGAATDAELADELYDTTLLLAMGSEGIAPDVAAGLRGRRLDALRELPRRCEATETET